MVGDVANVKPSDLPGVADLAWASFPCQDISLAGDRAGLDAARSGSFWPFWQLMQALRGDGRAPRLIVLENVTGLLTSHGGKDFDAICAALADAGYRFGVVMVDAALFVPQSRERVFVIGVDADADAHIPAEFGRRRADGAIPSSGAGRRLQTSARCNGGTRSGQDVFVHAYCRNASHALSRSAPTALGGPDCACSGPPCEVRLGGPDRDPP